MIDYVIAPRQKSALAVLIAQPVCKNEEAVVGGRSLVVGATLAFGIICAHAIASNAAELKVISGPATAGVLAQVEPQFERETGYKITKEGGVTGILKQLIESGEPFDVALIPATLMDDFVNRGKIVPNTNVHFVGVGMGIAIRAGAPKPDISSVEAFKQTLLDARSITFVPTGEAANHLSTVLTNLGIAEKVKAKLQPQQTVAACIESVASDKAELYVSLTNIIASAKGIELAGSFPPELQHYLVISAGVSSAAKQPKAAEALMKLLTSAAVRPIIISKGLEPIAQ
jgi:molybdate transport system substrate-binding protein